MKNLNVIELDELNAPVIDCGVYRDLVRSILTILRGMIPML